MWARVNELYGRLPVDVLVVVLTAVVTLPYLLVPYVVEGSPGWSLALTLAAGLALLFQRRALPFVLGWTVACGALHVVLTGEVGPTAVPIMVALYGLAIRFDRRVWLSAGATVAVAMFVVATFVNPGHWYRNLGTLVWVAFPLAVAQAVRNRRAQETAMEERARRQVLAERMRIARDLHDVLAHSMAVINVQSSAAAHVIDRHPEHAKQALVHINEASDAALSELRTTLDVLRQDSDPAAPTGPLPSLDQVDELVANARASGLDVRVVRTGDTTGVPPELGLVAYRVLQEALTNVIKHARARTVDVSLAVTDSQVVLDVRDDGVGSAGPPTYGHGRIGIRERVLAVGGTLLDGPADPGYRVTVTLPRPASPGGTS